MNVPVQNVRRFWLVAGIIACAGWSGTGLAAQTYPVKPIRIVVGYPPGGGTDVLTRIVAQRLSENVAQPVVVENRPGASGSIANERVAASVADGYTLLAISPSSVPQPALRAKLPYDFQRDLAPVALLATGANLLVLHAGVPVRNVEELIALARSKPGKLTYGSSGMGSAAHINGELFGLMAKVKLVHVPYKGAAESVVATAAGQIDMVFAALVSILPLLETGKVKALAVLDAKRASLLPSIPTLHESGLTGYDRPTWYGVLAPAGVPKNIIARLNVLINEVTNAPAMKTSLNKEGLEPQNYTPQQFEAMIAREIALNAKLIALAGAKAE